MTKISKKIILDTVSQSSTLILQIDKISDDILEISNLIIKCLKNNKIIIFGNGGSATDADHFVTELLGRFERERQSLAAISLTNPSTITAIGNDYGFENVFSRQCESLVVRNDIAIGISTSGNSLNVINAVKAAKDRGGIVIGLLGKDGGQLKDLVDIGLIIPSNVSDRIQEIHIKIIHIMIEGVERTLFPENY